MGGAAISRRTARSPLQVEADGRLIAVLLVVTAVFLLWPGAALALAEVLPRTPSQVPGGERASALLDLGTGETAPLFSGMTLEPGTPAARCAIVTYRGSDADPVVGVSATVGGSGLADYIRLVVEFGRGSADDCSDFAASFVIYAGSLSGFDGREIDVPLDAHSGGLLSGAYRFTVTLDAADDAQGRTATADFTWHVHE